MKRRLPVLRGPREDHELVARIRLNTVLHTQLLAPQPCPNSEHEYSRYSEVLRMSFSIIVLVYEFPNGSPGYCFPIITLRACRVLAKSLTAGCLNLIFLSPYWLAGVLCGWREQLEPRWHHLVENRLLLISLPHQLKSGLSWIHTFVVFVCI